MACEYVHSHRIHMWRWPRAYGRKLNSQVGSSRLTGTDAHPERNAHEHVHCMQMLLMNMCMHMLHTLHMCIVCFIVCSSCCTCYTCASCAPRRCLLRIAGRYVRKQVCVCGGEGWEGGVGWRGVRWRMRRRRRIHASVFKRSCVVGLFL